MNSYLQLLALFGIGGAHPGGLQLSKYILRGEKIANSTSILDVGCGTGQTAAYLKEQYQCHVTAIDINSIMIEKAKARFAQSDLQVNLIEGNIETINLPSQSFDLILAESVIAFTEAPATLAQFYRVLKPNGILLAIEFTNEGMLSKEELSEIKHFYGYRYILTEKEWIGLLSKANFRSINLLTISRETNNDGENFTEFHLSTNIKSEYYQFLEKHEQLNKQYENKMSYRIYRCIR